MSRIRFQLLALAALCTAALALGAATAHAANYRMLLCAGNNGSNGYDIATNTASGANPGGIFHFVNYCGPAPDPAGDNAWLRIEENQSGGNAGETAYGSISWTVPPWVAIIAGGGYTREPGSFNDGWRGRFWAEGFDGSTNNILMQGSGVQNGSCGGVCWATTSTFASHLWPFSGYGYYRRFVFEMTCFRPAGCDRSGWNAVDADTIHLTLVNVSPVDLHLTDTGAPLLGGQWVRGTQTATYSWSEVGSGIRMEWIDIDGARRFTIDHAGECDIGWSGASGEFARQFSPCVEAAGIGRSYGFDTASLPDGAHTLQACGQDYSQYQGLDGTGGASCDARTIRTDNTPPGKPAALAIRSANPNRYLDHFGATFSLPPDPGSPIAKVHYRILNAANEVVAPEKVLSGTNPTEVANIEAPAKADAYRLQVWLEDSVGFSGQPAEVAIPHDTTPPAAPQELQVGGSGTRWLSKGRRALDERRRRRLADRRRPLPAARTRRRSPRRHAHGQRRERREDRRPPDARTARPLQAARLAAGRRGQRRCRFDRAAADRHDAPRGAAGPPGRSTRHAALKGRLRPALARHLGTTARRSTPPTTRCSTVRARSSCTPRRRRATASPRSPTSKRPTPRATTR